MGKMMAIIETFIESWVLFIFLRRFFILSDHIHVLNFVISHIKRIGYIINSDMCIIYGSREQQIVTNL